MPTWLLSAGEAVIGLVSSLVNNAIKWAAAIAFFSVGVSAKRRKNQEEIIDVLREQRKVLQQPELHRGELLARARKRLRK
jgi:hypothetical protein